MTNPCCCIPPLDRCEARDSILAAILALPPATFTANLAGTATLQSHTTAASEEYISCEGFGGCTNGDCCNLCHPAAIPPCDYNLNCNYDEQLYRRACFNRTAGISTARVFSSNISTAECGCVGSPAPCVSCTGFSTCSFTNNGFGPVVAAAPISCTPFTFFNCPSSTFPPPQCPCTVCGTYNLAQNLVTTTVGANTTTTNKYLRLVVWNTYEKGVCVCRMLLRLTFRVNSGTLITPGCYPSGAQDGFFQAQQWQREWNGTDTLAQFLLKPLFLQCVHWGYSLCPGFGATTSQPFLCDTFSFTDSSCFAGSCDNTCTQAQLTLQTTDYPATFVGSTISCAAPMGSGIIDSTYQPWQGPPTTLAIT